jgi:PIN domain nuclease of toxin-antitoxin system
LRLLLDTHALLWWLEGNQRLSVPARSAIGDLSNTILVSAASAWEIATKCRIGKLPGAAVVALDLPGCLAAQGFEALPITLADGARAGSLGGEHRDPFDRMLIAQALAHDLTLISIETVFDGYGVKRLW